MWMRSLALAICDKKKNGIISGCNSAQLVSFSIFTALLLTLPSKFYSFESLRTSIQEKFSETLNRLTHIFKRSDAHICLQCCKEDF